MSKKQKDENRKSCTARDRFVSEKDICPDLYKLLMISHPKLAVF